MARQRSPTSTTPGSTEAARGLLPTEVPHADAAANAFMDGLASMRKANGLPALGA